VLEGFSWAGGDSRLFFPQTQAGPAGGLAMTTSRSDDAITITSADHSGEGLLTFSFVLLGDVSGGINAFGSFDGTMSASLQSLVEVNDRSFTNLSTRSLLSRDPVQFISDNRVNGMVASSAFGLFSYSVPVPLGVPFDLRLQLTTTSLARAIGSDSVADALAQATQSLDWKGIQALTIDGQAVDFDLASASGTDWRLPFGAIFPPVPEAPTWLLLLAGLALAGIKRLPRT
jgi:hypothetical protein